MSDKLTVLVTGAGGRLAPFIVDAASKHHVLTTGRSSGDMPVDLMDQAALSRVMVDAAPNVVIHTAAYTDVDGCERNPLRAFQENAHIVERLVRSLPEKCHLVSVSTDQVYGNCPGPHVEGTENPINWYGLSKMAGEWAALSSGRACVIRSNFFGPSRKVGHQSLSDFMIATFRNGTPATLFSDVLFSPLHASTLASILVACAEQRLTGVFNAGSHEGMSKAEFGLEISQRMAGPDVGNVRLGVSSEIHGRAPRPVDLRMCSKRLEDTLGVVLPTLSQEIDKLEFEET